MARNSPPDKTPTLLAPEFTWPVRVYYEDTDAAGVVYHSTYLNFMERARTEWLRREGYTQDVLARQEGIIFVVSELTVKYKKPACLDELLQVNSTIRALEGIRIDFIQSVTNESAVVICHAEVRIVCIGSATFKPKRIPNKIKAKLLNVN